MLLTSVYNRIDASLQCPTFLVDPFSDGFKDREGGSVQEGLIHVRIQQRNGRKTLTTVQGISPLYDLKRIVKACKKVTRRHSPELQFTPKHIELGGRLYIERNLFDSPFKGRPFKVLYSSCKRSLSFMPECKCIIMYRTDFLATTLGNS